MSSSEPVDHRVREARVVRVPHQERPAREIPPSGAAEPLQGRLIVRELHTDRPVPRPVAAERFRGDAESPRPGVSRADAPPGEEERPFRPRLAIEPAAHEREVVRRVHDDLTGGDWRVFERDARRVPGSRGPRCLYFDGEGIVRRVWHYPADWAQLPAPALLALMDRPPLGER
jgi:hypothetical protein